MKRSFLVLFAEKMPIISVKSTLFKIFDSVDIMAKQLNFESDNVALEQFFTLFSEMKCEDS